MGQLLDVVFMPHPPIMVPEVGGRELAKIEATVNAAALVADRVAAKEPETVSIISPHGPVFRDAVGIWAVPELSGSLAAFGAGHVSFRYPLDLELGRAIARAAREEDIAVAWLDTGAAAEYGLNPELDHGMMVPLYYLRRAGVDLPMVAMGTAYLERRELYAFGAAVAGAVEGSSRKVLLVVSGDLSHRLLPRAPAGYSPQGKVFDRIIKEALQSMDIQGILDIPEELAEDAGECGLRPLVMALGALDGYQVGAEVLSYEGPFGVGYLIAHFEPLTEDRGKSSHQAGDTAGNTEPVRLAKQSLEHYFRTGEVMPVPKPVPGELAGRAGAFVSIKQHGQLRGCIGTIMPTRENLAAEIIHNALAAGLEDPRFPPLSASELPELQFSVDILGDPEPAAMADLDPKIYGVIVSKGRRRGLLLPDLEGVDTAEKQVEIALGKAGISSGESYRLERFKVTRYY